MRCATKPVQFGDKSTGLDVTSPGRYLESLPTGSYVRVGDLPGSTVAAKAAASRAARKGVLAPVSRGLYFKGRPTRYGIATPFGINGRFVYGRITYRF